MTATDAPITLGPLGQKDHAKGAKLAARMFAHVAPEKQLARMLKVSDPDLSLALRRGKDLVGVYLARGPNKIMPFADVHAVYYTGLKGLRADALAVLPSLRGQGYGRLLRAALPALGQRRGYDFIWGAALHSLDNRDDWLKRRLLEREDSGGIVTIEPLNAGMRKLLAEKAPPEMLRKWETDNAMSSCAVRGRLVVEDRRPRTQDSVGHRGEPRLRRRDTQS